MKLKRTLYELLDSDTGYDNADLGDRIEKIVDENTVEFGKWLNNQVLASGGTHHRLRGRILVSDLYVIYKKEKGL